MNYLDKLQLFFLKESVSTPHQESPELEAAGPYQQQMDGAIRQIQPGDRVSWQRGDLSFQTGEVDFMHTDPAGLRWLGVTQANGDKPMLNEKFIISGKEQRPL